MTPVSQAVLDQAFVQARTFSNFTDDPVPDAILQRLYELAQWGPTSYNCQPARFVFIKSPEAKEKLKPSLSAGNLDKTMKAPVTVIVAQDVRFFEHLSEQFPHNPNAGAPFADNPVLAQTAGLRNGSLQGAYLMIAARLLGLDCGPMSGFNAALLDSAFFPDGRFKSNFLINLGYGDRAGLRPRGPRLAFAAAATVV